MSVANHGGWEGGVSALSVDCSCHCGGLQLSVWWAVAVAVVGCEDRENKLQVEDSDERETENGHPERGAELGEIQSLKAKC